MNSNDLIKILREVPQFRLRLIELAWELVGEDGLDPGKVTFYAKELTEAIEEAESYSRATKEVVRCLRYTDRSQS